MNNLKIISVLALFSAISSCVNDTATEVKKIATKEKVYQQNVEVLIIDGCEYILIRNITSSWGSHKGNCKPCLKIK